MARLHLGNPMTMPLRLSVLLAVLVAACVFAAPARALTLTPIADLHARIVYVTAPPNDPHRLFAVEQAGKIVEIRDGVVQDPPFLDITSDVRSTGNEQGLLSMAFAPDYATSGRYYVYYTAPRVGDTTGSVITVEEFSAVERHVVFTVDHPSNSNHNGGQLQFGPDGMLYAATGDGGSGNDPPGNAQNLSVRLGKMLRVDPLSANASTPEIFAYGLRNPFRFSFDRQTGDLVIADVGQSAREEVDFSAAGTTPGVNYGWVCREGTLQNPNASPPCTATGNVVDPVLEKNHTAVSSGGDGYCAIIGGYVLRNSDYGAAAGKYVYGDNCNTHIRSVALSATSATGDADTGLPTAAGLSSFGEDSCGHVYVASLNGPVSRIDGDTFTPCPEPSPSPGPSPGPSPDPSPSPSPNPTPDPGSGGTGNPPGDGGGPPGPVADTIAPRLRLGALRKRSARRARSFRVSVGCDEPCTATITGRLHVRGVKRTFRFGTVSRKVALGELVKVTFRPSARALRTLRRHHHGTATFSASAHDAAGNVAVPAKRETRLIP
jgi:Glucose / Sorbosone dehydrogenase